MVFPEKVSSLMSNDSSFEDIVNFKVLAQQSYYLPCIYMLNSDVMPCHNLIFISLKITYSSFLLRISWLIQKGMRAVWWNIKSLAMINIRLKSILSAHIDISQKLCWWMTYFCWHDGNHRSSEYLFAFKISFFSG